MDTVKVTINGRELTVEKGKTVLQAALENGIELPYYCYHPGLGVDGSCRVCIVKIEKMPKLQTSCSTMCTDGMVVHTQTPDVVEARAGVFEFLLINHPLDCPVCDKGGECPLQDFSYEFGPDRSRMEFPRRTFDGEGVEADVDFGPTLMLNRNRCILCTRCIRFMRDIDGDAQIGVTDRGAGSEISTYKEEGVHSLLSGNLMDVCPVGAITTRDYRFKSRPWDNPLAGDTICTFCSKGCNTTVWIKAKPEWARGAQMARVTPRFNPEVNSYWMCDIGRFDYHWVEGDRRLVQPLVRASNGVQQPVNWHDVWRALRAPVAEAQRRIPHPHVGARLARRAACAEAAGEGPGRADLGRLHRHREEAARRREVQSAGRQRAERERRARSRPEGARRQCDGARSQRAAPSCRRRPGESAVCVRSRTSRIARRRVVDRRRARERPPAVADRARRRAFGADGRRRLRAVGLDVVREGRVVHERPGQSAGSRDRHRGAGRRAGRLPHPRELRDARSASRVSTPERARTEIAAELIHLQAYGALQQMMFSRPVSVRTWLQMSNPSERWKWDFLFQDLPPVKGALDPSSLPPAPASRPGEGGPPGVIRLKPVE